MSLTCPSIDDYLSGELSDQERATFEEHLRHCPACHELVQGQQRISQLLRRAIPLTPLPATLAERCQLEIRRQQRRRQAMWVGSVSAVAAVLLLIAAWVSQRPEHPPVASFPASEPSPVENIEPTRLDPQSQIAIDPQSGYLAVPQPSENANVTILWLYPVVNAVAPVEAPANGDELERNEI